MKSLKKIWSDPVWSKVIAGVILSVLSAAAIYLFPPVQAIALRFWGLLLDGYGFVTANPLIVATGILTLVVIILLLKLSRTSRASSDMTTDQLQTGVEWLSSLSDEEFHKYTFLLWFPLNHTLKTPKYYSGSESLDHVPEIHELVRRRVLKIVVEDIIHFSAQIQSEVYDHLDKELSHAWSALPQEQRDNLQQFKRADFGLMVRGRSNVR